MVDGLEEDFNEEIENCCRENLISLLKYFIDDNGAKLKTKNDFLIINEFDAVFDLSELIIWRPISFTDSVF